MIDYQIDLGPDFGDVLIGMGMQGKEFRKLQRALQIGAGLIGVLFLIVGFMGKDIIMIAGGAIFLILAVCVPQIQKKGALDALKKMDPRTYQGLRHYVIDDSGIEITSYAGHSKTNWSIYKEYGEYQHYIWIRRSDRNALILDKNDLTEEEQQELYRYLMKYIR